MFSQGADLVAWFLNGIRLPGFAVLDHGIQNSDYFVHACCYGNFWFLSGRDQALVETFDFVVAPYSRDRGHIEMTTDCLAATPDITLTSPCPAVVV